jgi:hypothetical protein
LGGLIPAGDIGYGMAWGYYYGYQKLILPGLRQRTEEFVKNGELHKWLVAAKINDFTVIDRFLMRFICVLPLTSLCPGSFSEKDKNIRTIGAVDFDKTISGNIKRNYKTCIHFVSHPHDKTKVSAVQCLTSLI